MKKLIFGIVLLFCVNSYAINGFSIYKMYTQYDTVTHLNLDSNLNRPASWSSLLVDTLDRKFIRFSDLTNGDTTLSSIKVDTIRSNPYIDSTKGNTIHTGNYTTTGSMTVDTLKSTKGINATGGTFSGRVTGSDIQLSDSVKAVYGDFSGVLEVDSLKSTKGINATGGTFSGRVTGSDIQLSDSVKAVYGDFSGSLEVDSLKSLKGINATGGTFSGALTSQTVNTGNGDNELYAMDQNVRTTDAPTFATVNTGNGANELYPMNQGVRTTDDVAFDSTRTRVNVVDSLKLGTGSYLKTYLDTTFYDSLYDGEIFKIRNLARIVQVGNKVTLYQPELTSTSFSYGARIGGIPSKFLPPQIFVPALIRSNNTLGLGYLNFNNTVLGYPSTFIYISSNTLASGAGSCGVSASVFTWIIQ